MADGAASEYRERELKFDVPPDWTLPDPAELTANGSVEHETVRLETTYFDTEAQDLLRHRVTLRARRGEHDAGWQLKVPAGDARIEVRLPPNGDGVPDELCEITVAVRGDAPLTPLATLTTEREIYRLFDDGGTPLAEIVLDAVTATPARTTRTTGAPRRWREVEVELLDGDEEVLDGAARWLTQRGARFSPSTSKLARALDAEPRKPRDLGTLAGLAGRYLDAQVDALVRGDIGLRRGQDLIHPTRVATRRYRSVLRVLGSVFDPQRAAALDAELAWYAAGLGAVRDLRVLRAHLDDALQALPPELVLGPVAARMHQAIAADEHAALDRLGELMRSPRYAALVAELSAWREELPVAADEPAPELARRLRKARRKVRRRLKHAPDGAGRDEALHRARKAAKRTRYLAELAEPELDEAATAVADRMEQLQDRLGLRQDCVVAAAFLRRLGAAAGAAGDNGFTYGLLYERELARARELG